MRIPDPKANTTTEAYLAYKAGYLEESELKPSLYEPYLHFDGWLAYWAGLVDYFPVKRSEDGKNLMPILPGKISYRGLDITVGKDGTITLNGHTTGAVTIKLSNGLEESGNVKTDWVNQDITDDVDGKCISLRYISGSAPASATALRLYGSSGSAAIAQWYFQSNDQNTVFSTTSKASCLVIYANQNLDFNNYKFRVQFEDNPAPTDYMPYASVPEMLTDEEALVAYLSGVTDTYPQEIKDPYDVRIVGYLKHLVSIRWPEPDYPVNNEEFYLSTMEPTHTSNSEPSANIELDTAEGKIISVEAYGDTSQQTYTGKNQFNIQTLAQGSITVTDGVASGTMAQFYTEFQNGITLASTASAMSITATAYHDGEPSSGNGFVFRAVYTDETTENIVIFPNSTTTATTLTGTTDSSKTLSKIAIAYGSGSSNVWHVSNIQIEAGSTATSYEPYVGGMPAPNPDYPQDVNVVTGKQTVKMTGKNLFSGDYSQFDSIGGTGNLYGYFKLPESGDFTFTLIAKNDIGAHSPQKYIGFTAQGGSATGGFVWLYAGSTIMQKGDVRSIRNTYLGNRLGYISIYPNNETTLQWFMDNFYIQLEAGSTITDYKPYQSSDYTVNLGSIELCKIGDYQDYIYKSGDDWYLHKETGEYTFTGSETIGKAGNTSNNSYYYASSQNPNYGFAEIDKTNMTSGDSSSVVIPTYSRYFIASSSNTVTRSSSVGLSFNLSGTGGLDCRIGVGLSSPINTADLLKTWLTNNVLTVYYPLATPTDTQITNSALIGQLDALADADTYDEKTYIRVTATDPNLPALLKVEAYKY